MQNKFTLSGLVFMAMIANANAQFSGQGSGTTTDPYQISNAVQLDEVRNYLGQTNEDVHFELVNDIDLGNLIDTQYATVGWLPIGSNTDGFSGNIDGGGHTVSNLWISRNTEDNVGLFGYLENAEITDLKISTATKGVVGGENTGVFAGSVSGGAIDFIDVDGNVTGYGHVGGLIGNLTDINELTNCSSSGFVFGDGNYLGGLIGQSYSAVADSHSSANVKNIGDTYVGTFVGGLIGEAQSTVNTSYATGSVEGTNVVGGLVGNSFAAITDSYATGAVSGTKSIGGLVGASDVINKSYATGNVTGVENVGGLAGENYNTINNGKSTGTVSGTKEVGGLVGFANNLIDSSLSSSNVIQVANNGIANLDVGGLVGQSFALVSNSYATGDITVMDNAMYIGGLVGISGEIQNSYASGTITGGSALIGGLVGDPTDDVSNSFALNTSITGAANADYSRIHRFIGSIDQEVELTNNFALEQMLINNQTIMQPDPLHAEDISFSNAQQGSSYADVDWDFDTIWTIDEGNSFPYFGHGLLEVNDPIFEEEQLTIYPNPATDIININSAKDINAVAIYDATGKLVKKVVATSQIQISDLNAGIYFVKISLSNNNVVSTKFIKR